MRLRQRLGAPSLALAAVALVAVEACRTVRGLSPEPFPIRTLVYNIHAGADAAGERNLERVADLIVRSRADVVLLQEVDRNTARSGSVDQLARLADLTKLHSAFGRTLHYQGGEYGIAILSRWPIVRDTLLPLPVQPPQERAGGSYEPRGLLHATIATTGGTLHVLNTHLDASAEDHYRLQEMARVLLVANRLMASDSAVLLGGDFNATPESKVIALVRQSAFRDAWLECGGLRPGSTYPANAPRKRIDYLLVPPAVRCDSASVIESLASDHRPISFQLGVHFVVRARAPLQYDPRLPLRGRFTISQPKTQKPSNPVTQ